MTMQNIELKEEIKQFINNIENEFAEIRGGSFYHIEAEEYFTQTEHDKYIKKKLEIYKAKLLSEINEIAKDEKGIENDQFLRNKRSNKPEEKSSIIKARYGGGDFNKVYRNKIEVLQNMKLTVNEKLVYYILRDFVQHPTNCVAINNQIPSVKELEPIIGLTERSIIDVLKSLEEKGLIKRVQYGHRKSIYINPAYYATGTDLDSQTLKMFNLLECDDEKINNCLELNK